MLYIILKPNINTSLQYMLTVYIILNIIFFWKSSIFYIPRESCDLLFTNEGNTVHEIFLYFRNDNTK